MVSKEFTAGAKNCRGRDLSPVQVALHLSDGSPISLAETPVAVNLLAHPFTIDICGRTRSVWDEGNELLKWFSTAACATNKVYQDGDNEACLVLNAMEKERCHWHTMAKDNRLASLTEGNGPRRSVHIFKHGRTQAFQKALAFSADNLLNTTFSKDLWLSCHLEGGALADLSPVDIKHLCTRAEQIPHDVLQAHRIRVQVHDLGASICCGNFERAASIVHQYPSSLCKIVETGFTYPAHMACARGAAQLVEAMLSAAHTAGIDVLAIPDLSGRTPIEVARAHGQYACAKHLEKLLGFCGKPRPPLPEPVESNASRKVAAAAAAATTSLEEAGERGPVEIYRYERPRDPPEESNRRRRRRGGKRGNNVYSGPMAARASSREKNRVVVVNREQIRQKMERESTPFATRSSSYSRRGRRHRQHCS